MMVITSQMKTKALSVAVCALSDAPGTLGNKLLLWGLPRSHLAAQMISTDDE